MKKKLMLLVSIASSFILVNTNIFAGLICKTKGDVKTYDYKKSGKNLTKVGFSIKNKSNKGILFSFDNESNQQAAKIALKPNEYREFEIDINKPTEARVYDPSTMFSKSTASGTKTIFKASFNTGKTIHVAWDGKTIRPRQAGWIGATDECQSLNNNVTNNDINVLID